MKGIHQRYIGLSLTFGVAVVWSTVTGNVIPLPPLPVSDRPDPSGVNSLVVNPKNETYRRDIIPPPPPLPPPPPPPLHTEGTYDTSGIKRPEVIPNAGVSAIPAVTSGEETSHTSANKRNFESSMNPLPPSYPLYDNIWIDSTSHSTPIYPSFQQQSTSQEVIYKTNQNEYYPPQQQVARSNPPPPPQPYQPSPYSQYHSPSPRTPTLFQSKLVQRMTKTLDTFADVDDLAQDMLHSSATLIQHAAQNMKRTSQHAAGNVLLAGATVASSVRGWMNRWQDQAWSALRGAPTQSDEAKTEWEEDRRVSIEADRRRRWLGQTSESNPQDHLRESAAKGGTEGETDRVILSGSRVMPSEGTIPNTPYTKVAPSTIKELTPFQKQLASLALPPAKDLDEDSDIEDADNDEKHPEITSTISTDSSMNHERDRSWNSGTNDAASVQTGDPRDMFATKGRFDFSVRTTSPVQSQPLSSYSTSDDNRKNDDMNEKLVKAPNLMTHLKSNSIYDFDNDENSSLSKKARNIVSSVFTMIPLRFQLKGRKKHEWIDSDWSNYNENTLGSTVQPVKSKTVELKSGAHPPLMNEIRGRQALQTQVVQRNTINLLSLREINVCRDIGRVMACFDFLKLMLVFLAAKELLYVLPLSSLAIREIPKSWTQVQEYFKGLMVTMSKVDWIDSWFFHSCIASVLTGTTRDLLFRRKIQFLSDRTRASMKQNASYAQLFFRLMAGYQVKPSLSNLLSIGVAEQVYATVAVSRLRSFFALMFSSLLLVTLTTDPSFLHSTWKVLVDISKIEVFRRWPFDGAAAYKALKTFMFSFIQVISAKARIIETMLFDNPVPIALNILFVSALYLTSRMHEVKSAVQNIKFQQRSSRTDETDDDEDSSISGALLLSNMGASSANRINMLVPDGSVQFFIDRWSEQQRDSSRNPKSRRLNPATHIITTSAYHVISIFLLMIPLALQAYVSLTYQKPGDWTKLIDMCVIIIATYGLAQESLMHTIRVFQFMPIISMFYQRIAQINEINLSQPNSYQRSHPIKDAASNTVGLEVRDLWAAHSSKRAWACKGITISGRKGEITLILGDEASGKSRLLTALAECLLNVPKLSRSTQIVRGSVHISGTDVLQWNPVQLKRRVGVVMSSVRSLSDLSQVLSGMKLYEILNPISLGAKAYASKEVEKSALGLASEITSISSTLIPRLPPSKLSTLVTVNENDLTRSTAYPSFILSSSDWEKIILTRVLAQLISANQIISSSVKQCMENAVLLLDDMGLYMNEIQQAKLLNNLRKSGAVTLITSNHWSVGRLADKIYVVQNGAIVEQGTHNELLDRGAQRGLYAARWKEMIESI